MFELTQTQRNGLLSLDADVGINKRNRGPLLASGAEKYNERTHSLGDYPGRKLVEPGNALFWKHSKTGQLAPAAPGAHGPLHCRKAPRPQRVSAAGYPLDPG